MPTHRLTPSLEPANDIRSPGIRLALAHIERNFTQSILLDQLAKIAGLCVWRFVTVFREQVGLTPHRFICHRRVEHAKELLAEGLPYAIVAVEAGFFDQSHFCRHFKAVCGMTPGQYVANARSAAWEPAFAAPVAPAARAFA